MMTNNACPYFRDNRCCSESYELLKIKTRATAICGSSQHSECPVYRITVTKHEEKAEAQQ